MSARPKRSQSSARPGKIVNDSKQKRRSTNEKATDELRKEQLKATQEREAVEAHLAGVQCVADKEDAIRLEDQHRKAHSARPDLVTARPNRPTEADQGEQASLLFFQHVPTKTKNEANDAGDSDGDYRPGLDDVDDEAGDDMPGLAAASDSESEVDDDSEAEAIKQLLKSRAASKKKQAAKATKPVKGALRMQIGNAANVPMPTDAEKTLKRKPSGQSGEVQAKKSKPTIGGLKKGWQKAVSLVTKNDKTSKGTTGVAYRCGRTTSMSSASMASRATSASSAKDSVAQDEMGEFDHDESPASLQAARGSKASSGIVNATAKVYMLHGVSGPGKFSVDAEGGLARSGDAEKSDAESESESEAVEVAPASPVVLGRGQRKKTGNTRYRAEIWEGH
ncbi:hypothetical protein C8R44DRAFT_930198 [Mycena epipterygia]|nr:hypothetical protein C8R44DRAFT_930198 [Mycena epipterygia]